MELPKKIVSRDGKHVGTPIGTTRMCRLEGCTGLRIGVRWDDGKLTYPCSKGLRWSPKGTRATII